VARSFIVRVRFTGNRGLMQAIVHERYGGPEVLELRAVDKPAPDRPREKLVITI